MTETKPKTGRPKTIEKLTIGNTTIQLGKKYTLENKFDASAPDGMKSIKATKFPIPDNDSVNCVYYDDNTQQYDTGLQVNSRCLSTLNRDVAAERVESYRKHILLPYEKFRNADLSSTSDFWKSYRYITHLNKEFDTNNILDLFDLFNALMQGSVCNENERDPLYRTHANFIISNNEEAKDKSNTTVKKKMDTVMLFNTMVDSNRDKLNIILSYLNRGDSERISPDTLKTTYYSIINDEKTGDDFVKRFTEANDKYSIEEGKQEMEYFRIVKLLSDKNQIKRVGSRYVTANNDVYLGNTLQDIAKFCVNQDTTQNKVINELYEKIEN
jgi:hypothetical protein